MTMMKTLFAAALGVAALAAAPAGAVTVFGATSYNSSLTLAQNPNSVGMGVTFTNGNYYTVQGGYSTSPITQYNASGTVTAGPVAPTPGIDFRSISTTSAGVTYARGYNSNVIYRQSGAFNNFVAAVTLGGSLGDQQQVVVSADGSTFYGNNNGNLQVWNSSGTLLRTVALGSGTSSTSIALFGNYGINQNGGILRAFDLTTGALVDQTTLTGSLSAFYGDTFGQSYANGYFFALGSNDGNEVGYAIGTPAGAVPEPASWAMMIGGFGLVGGAMRRRKSSVRTNLKFA